MRQEGGNRVPNGNQASGSKAEGCDKHADHLDEVADDDYRHDSEITTMGTILRNDFAQAVFYIAIERLPFVRRWNDAVKGPGA